MNAWSSNHTFLLECIKEILYRLGGLMKKMICIFWVFNRFFRFLVLFSRPMGKDVVKSISSPQLVKTWIGVIGFVMRRLFYRMFGRSSRPRFLFPMREIVHIHEALMHDNLVLNPKVDFNLLIKTEFRLGRFRNLTNLSSRMLFQTLPIRWMFLTAWNGNGAKCVIIMTNMCKLPSTVIRFRSISR